MKTKKLLALITAFALCITSINFIYAAPVEQTKVTSETELAKAFTDGKKDILITDSFELLNETKILINSTVTIDKLKTLTVKNKLIINGTIIVNGALTIESGQTNINKNGSIVNNGIFKLSNGRKLINNGTVTTSGEMNIAGTYDNKAKTIITNKGKITGTALTGNKAVYQPTITADANAFTKIANSFTENISIANLKLNNGFFTELAPESFTVTAIIVNSASETKQTVTKLVTGVKGDLMPLDITFDKEGLNTLTAGVYKILISTTADTNNLAVVNTQVDTITVTAVAVPQITGKNITTANKGDINNQTINFVATNFIAKTNITVAVGTKTKVIEVEENKAYAVVFDNLNDLDIGKHDITAKSPDNAINSSIGELTITQGAKSQPIIEGSNIIEGKLGAVGAQKIKATLKNIGTDKITLKATIGTISVTKDVTANGEYEFDFAAIDLNKLTTDTYEISITSAETPNNSAIGKTVVGKLNVSQKAQPTIEGSNIIEGKLGAVGAQKIKATLKNIGTDKITLKATIGTISVTKDVTANGEYTFDFAAVDLNKLMTSVYEISITSAETPNNSAIGKTVVGKLTVSQKTQPTTTGTNVIAGNASNLGDIIVKAILKNLFPEEVILSVTIDNKVISTKVNRDGTYEFKFAAADLNKLAAGIYEIWLTSAETTNNYAIKKTSIGKLTITQKGNPVISSASTTRTSVATATINFKSDTNGTYYYLIQNEVPTVARLKSNGSRGTTITNSNTTINITGLSDNIMQKIHIIVESANGGATSIISTLNIPAYTVTNPGGNTNIPSLSSAEATRVTDTRAAISFKSTLDGTFYYLVQDSTPTEAKLLESTNYGKVRSGETKTFNIDDLRVNRQEKVYIMTVSSDYYTKSPMLALNISATTNEVVGSILSAQINIDGKNENHKINTKHDKYTIDISNKQTPTITLSYTLLAQLTKETSGRADAFLLEISTPIGIYQIPSNLYAIIPEFDKILGDYKLDAKDIDFKVSMTNEDSNNIIERLIKSTFPKAKSIGQITDFKIELVNNKTSKIIEEIRVFTKPITRLLPIGRDLPTQWGAFRYNTDTNKFEFVPHIKIKVNNSQYVKMATKTNSIYFVLDNPVAFTDVKSGFWGKVFIEQAAAKGLVVGVGNNIYEPNREVTRAEFVQMITSTVYIEESWVSDFNDVKSGDWFYGSVAKAKAAGLLKGFDGNNFYPNKPITREEMASILAAVVRRENIPVTANYIELSTVFTDYKNMSSKYINDIELIYKLKIMIGMSGNTFEPKGVTTRAQAATVQVNMLKVFGAI